MRGEDKVEKFKLPEADRFSQAFCRDCGSKLPHVRLRAVIPAGSLDDDPGIRPALHIFVASKAPWFAISDDLPRYDEYAPGMLPSPPPA
ncbi:MAG: GFA family protein [Myxococcota bacterium]